MYKKELTAVKKSLGITYADLSVIMGISLSTLQRVIKNTTACPYDLEMKFLSIVEISKIKHLDTSFIVDCLKDLGIMGSLALFHSKSLIEKPTTSASHKVKKYVGLLELLQEESSLEIKLQDIKKRLTQGKA